MMAASSIHRAWRSLEAVHGMIYFAPEAHERYAKLGLDQRAGYFASRSAAFGVVSAETVIATFFNFCPDLVRGAIPSAWQHTTPSQVLEARLDAVDHALRRGLGDLISSDGLGEAARLARTAAESVCDRLEGRPLFAAHTALPWPDEPHLVLWHAQTLLREFRGDGHIAALVVEGVSGIEALVLHAATGAVSAEALRTSRAWSTEDWNDAVNRLRERGFVATDGSLTEQGKVFRGGIEDRTDALAAPAYAVLGDDGIERLTELGAPLSLAITESGMLPLRK